jgi:hypothetical protein
LNNWIVIKNYKGQSPVILFDAWNGIRISGGASFIEINGLIIRGNSANIKLSDALNQPGGCNNPAGTVSGVYNGNGITIDGSQGGHCHHVRIKNTTVYECPSAGIGSVQCDYITIDSCFIYNNCWYTLFGTSGIDLFQNWNVDNASGYHNFVTHNKSFGNRLYVPWASECTIKDGNGIIIDGSKFADNGAGYRSRTLVAYNIVAGNGGSGIHTYRSAHIDIVNNIAYQNQQSAEINYGEIFASLSTDVAFYNNILDGLPNKKLNSYTYVNDTNIRYDYNLHFGGTGPAEIVGPHTIVSDPLFTNPSTNMATADFSLKKGSPAIAKGLDLTTILLAYNWPKPANGAPDIGAVMYVGTTSIKRKITAQITPYSIPRSFIGSNQVLIRAKSGFINVQGKNVLEKSEENSLRH